MSRNIIIISMSHYAPCRTPRPRSRGKTHTVEGGSLYKPRNYNSYYHSLSVTLHCSLSVCDECVQTGWLGFDSCFASPILQYKFAILFRGLVRKMLPVLVSACLNPSGWNIYHVILKTGRYEAWLYNFIMFKSLKSIGRATFCNEQRTIFSPLLELATAHISLSSVFLFSLLKYHKGNVIHCTFIGGRFRKLLRDLKLCYFESCFSECSVSLGR
jgi:hypothetical protein